MFPHSSNLFQVLESARNRKLGYIISLTMQTWMLREENENRFFEQFRKRFSAIGRGANPKLCCLSFSSISSNWVRIVLVIKSKITV